MIFTWSREPKSIKVARGSLQWLNKQLASEYLRDVSYLRYLSATPNQIDPLTKATRTVAQIRVLVLQLVEAKDLDIQEVRDQLRQRSEQVSTALSEGSPENHAARSSYTQVLSLLNRVDAKITSVLLKDDPEIPRRIMIPSEYIFQARHQLFPAERMLVAAGRQDGGTTKLSAVFDVTGTSSGGHVRADPNRLASALIAMDQSGASLALWLHSHPGMGAQATQPSSIDLRQHQDWIRDYTPFLISGIIVADGWIRFWGSALESNKIMIEITHSGIVKEEKDGCVYRFAN